MGLSHSLTLILRIQSRRALLPEGIDDIEVLIRHEARLDVRLSAAGDAAARAAHDLDELILALAGPDLVEQHSGVLHAVRYRYPYRRAIDVDARLADALETTDLFKLDQVMLFAGQCEVRRTQRSFHNAAGDAEDDARAGVIADDVIVELFLGQSLEVDTGALDQLRQLSGRQNSVDILDAVMLQLLSFLLELLCGTRHDGDDEHILRVDAVLLAVVALEDGAEHLVRRLAGGQMREQIPVVDLREVDPSG